jgi:hypothetical protein
MLKFNQWCEAKEKMLWDFPQQEDQPMNQDPPRKYKDGEKVMFRGRVVTINGARLDYPDSSIGKYTVEVKPGATKEWLYSVLGSGREVREKNLAPIEPVQLPTSTGNKSPFMMRYEKFKNEHPGMMILYRVGDFYEMFWDDAKKAAKILGLTITSRDDRISGEIMPMAGFPHHMLERSLHTLLKAGVRVAVADLEENRSTADQIRRKS